MWLSTQRPRVIPNIFVRFRDQKWASFGDQLHLRPMDPLLLKPEQVTGHAPGGRVERYIALPVGYGFNALTVNHVNGRLILGNGSYRAYCLMEAGIASFPAVVQRIGSIEELALACPPVSLTPEAYLTAPRPPLLADYFTPALVARFDRPRSVRQVKVAIGSELQDL